MVWPTTNQANNFDNSFFQGFIDVSGGDIINRNGGIYAIDGSGIFQDLLVNTINEKITNTGVTIDSVLLKDNNVTAHTISAQNYSVGNVNFISASRQGNFRDLEVKDTNNNATILLVGDGGNMDLLGIIDITGKSIMRSDLSLNGNITTNGFVHQF